MAHGGARTRAPHKPQEPTDEDARVGQWHRLDLERMNNNFAKAITREAQRQAAVLPSRGKRPPHSE